MDRSAAECRLDPTRPRACGLTPLRKESILAATALFMMVTETPDTATTGSSSSAQLPLMKPTGIMTLATVPITPHGTRQYAPQISLISMLCLLSDRETLTTRACKVATKSMPSAGPVDSQRSTGLNHSPIYATRRLPSSKWREIFLPCLLLVRVGNNKATRLRPRVNAPPLRDMEDLSPRDLDYPPTRLRIEP